MEYIGVFWIQCDTPYHQLERSPGYDFGASQNQAAELGFFTSNKARWAMTRFWHALRGPVRR